MEWELSGSFLIPKGTALKDLGGKAERLIEKEAIARKHGFSLPEAIALPWQTFAGLPDRKGITAGSSMKYEYYTEFNNNEFSDIEKAVVQEVLSWINYPFFSSSAPGEDSVEARMPGVYESKEGISMDSFTRHYPAEKELSKEEGHLLVNIDKVGKVLASYHTNFAAGLRKKHGIPHTGMGILVREVVGGEDGPSYSIVIQTDHPYSVNVGVIEKFGENLVLGRGGKHYRYDSASKTFEEAVDNYPFDLQGIVERTLAFEGDLNLPDGFGGDYEIALDGKHQPYLLQCPPLPKQKDIGRLPKKGNKLSNPQTLRGNIDASIDTVVFIEEYVQPQSPILEDLFNLNKDLSNYLLIVRALPGLWIPECAYNAAGITEFFRSEIGPMESPRGNSVISHYATLLRTEKIGFVNADLSENFLSQLGFAQGGNKSHIRVHKLPMQLKINQIRGEAGLYAREA